MIRKYLLAPLLALSLLGTAPAVQAQTVVINEGATLTVESGALLYVAGSVQNSSTSTFANAGTLQLTGDLTNDGTLTSPGLLHFVGATNQMFSPGTATVTDLTLDNTGAVGQRTLSIPADVTISGQLTLVSGLLRTAAVGISSPLFTLTLPDGATLTGEQADRYVQGNLRVVRDAVNGGAVTFPNSVVLNPNGQDLGTVTITRTAGLSAAGVSYGQNLTGANKGIDRVWTIASSQTAQPATATPASVTLSWVSDDDNGFNLATPAQLWHAATAAGPWSKQGAPASASSRSFTSDITQLGAFTVSNSSAPLPVELTRFTATAQGGGALLQWATATEKNNDHFDVEASADGKQFVPIGVVAGHGTSAQLQQYQLVDPAIARYAVSLLYYRLRQVDSNGTFRYSPVRTVAVSGRSQLALFPNPTSQTATLTHARPGTVVTVYDALSRQVLTATTDATGTATLVLPAGLATGGYLVRTGVTALRLHIRD
jgi:hypothetical protein